MLERRDLHVILVISNYMQFETRVNHFRDAYDRLEAAGVTVWVAECQVGNRDFTVIDPHNPRHVGFRSHYTGWLKEPMINQIVTRFPHDWQRMMWYDADIAFVDPNWVEKVLHALEAYPVVQCFSHAIDLGPNNEVMQNHVSFAHQYCKGETYKGPYGGPYWHPGYCWAWRREAWDACGGMLDVGIAGAGDHHMALALINKAAMSVPGNTHPNYLKAILAWEKRAVGFVRKDIGCVEGTILHYFHGWKEDRGYQSRWQILVKHGFDPYADIRRDWQGLPLLEHSKPELHRALRAYAGSRNEDTRVRRPSKR